MIEGTYVPPARNILLDTLDSWFPYDKSCPKLRKLSLSTKIDYNLLFVQTSPPNKIAENAFGPVLSYHGTITC